MMHRARWIYPALVCILIALYYAVPAVRVPAAALVGLTGAFTVLMARAIRRPARQGGWLLLAVGIVVLTIGEVCFIVLAGGGSTDNYPSLPDLFYFAAYPPVAVGLLWLGLARTPSRDAAAVIDVAATTLAGTLIAWITLIRPTVDSLHLTGFGKAVAVAGWVGDVMVLAAGIRLVIVWWRNVAAVMLGGAVVAVLIGDVGYGRQLIDGTWRDGGPIDLGILAFLALCGGAALVPSMAQIGAKTAARHYLGPAQLLVFAVALLVAPSALIAEATHGPVGTPVAIAAVSGAVGLLVLLRLVGAVRAHRRALAREIEVRRATHLLGLAVTPDAVVASLATALAAMAGGLPTTVRLDHHPDDQPPDDQMPDDQMPDDQAPPGADAELRVPVAGFDDRGDGVASADGATPEVVYTAPAAALAELDGVLTGLADQAAVALQRIDLAARTRESEKEQDALAYRASHDGLTGLANGELFRDELRAASRITASGGLTAVLFIDLDDFKTTNDMLGHEVGDAVLVSSARRIQSCLRRHDLAARLGGDEFAVLLRDIANAEAAHVVARRITEELAKPDTTSGYPVVCRASVGLATASRPYEYDALLRRADTALYAAKAAGKGKWRLYDASMPSPLRRSSDLRVELERVLRPGGGSPSANGLAMHYQPIVDLTTGTVRGFEALIRWQHPTRGTIPVPDLIAIAEHTGLILPLGDWVMRRACTDAIRLAPESGYMSVNVSATQLSRPHFAGRVRDTLRSTGLDPARLCVEITESLFVADDEHIWDDLGELRRLGVRIALDDYGTGYASLGYLRRPVIDVLKLDRMFLADVATPRTQTLLRAVVRLTADLGLDLIAEGIENEETRDLLVELGYTLGQGHLFAAAMPLAAALRWTPPATQPAQAPRSAAQRLTAP